MPYVITNECCKDDVCATACPEEAITSGTVEVDGVVFDQYFIDPDKCSDCGTCESGCPTAAIYFDADLPAKLQNFLKVNASFFKQ